MSASIALARWPVNVTTQQCIVMGEKIGKESRKETGEHRMYIGFRPPVGCAGLPVPADLGR